MTGRKGGNPKGNGKRALRGPAPNPRTRGGSNLGTVRRALGATLAGGLTRRTASTIRQGGFAMVARVLRGFLRGIARLFGRRGAGLFVLGMILTMANGSTLVVNSTHAVLDTEECQLSVSTNGVTCNAYICRFKKTWTLGDEVLHQGKCRNEAGSTSGCECRKTNESAPEVGSIRFKFFTTHNIERVVRNATKIKSGKSFKADGSYWGNYLRMETYVKDNLFYVGVVFLIGVMVIKNIIMVPLVMVIGIWFLAQADAGSVPCYGMNSRQMINAEGSTQVRVHLYDGHCVTVHTKFEHAFSISLDNVAIGSVESIRSLVLDTRLKSDNTDFGCPGGSWPQLDMEHNVNVTCKRSNAPMGWSDNCFKFGSGNVVSCVELIATKVAEEFQFSSENIKYKMSLETAKSNKSMTISSGDLGGEIEDKSFGLVTYDCQGTLTGSVAHKRVIRMPDGQFYLTEADIMATADLPYMYMAGEMENLESFVEWGTPSADGIEFRLLEDQSHTLLTALTHSEHVGSVGGKMEIHEGGVSCTFNFKRLTIDPSRSAKCMKGVTMGEVENTNHGTMVVKLTATQECRPVLEVWLVGDDNHRNVAELITRGLTIGAKEKVLEFMVAPGNYEIRVGDALGEFVDRKSQVEYFVKDTITNSLYKFTSAYNVWHADGGFGKGFLDGIGRAPGMVLETLLGGMGTFTTGAIGILLIWVGSMMRNDRAMIACLGVGILIVLYAVGYVRAEEESQESILEAYHRRYLETKDTNLGDKTLHDWGEAMMGLMIIIGVAWILKKFFGTMRGASRRYMAWGILIMLPLCQGDTGCVYSWDGQGVECGSGTFVRSQFDGTWRTTAYPDGELWDNITERVKEGGVCVVVRGRTMLELASRVTFQTDENYFSPYFSKQTSYREGRSQGIDLTDMATGNDTSKSYIATTGASFVWEGNCKEIVTISASFYGYYAGWHKTTVLAKVKPMAADCNDLYRAAAIKDNKVVHYAGNMEMESHVSHGLQKFRMGSMEECTYPTERMIGNFASGTIPWQIGAPPTEHAIIKGNGVMKTFPWYATPIVMGHGACPGDSVTQNSKCGGGKYSVRREENLTSFCYLSKDFTLVHFNTARYGCIYPHEVVPSDNRGDHPLILWDVTWSLKKKVGAFHQEIGEAVPRFGGTPGSMGGTPEEEKPSGGVDALPFDIYNRIMEEIERERHTNLHVAILGVWMAALCCLSKGSGLPGRYSWGILVVMATLELETTSGIILVAVVSRVLDVRAAALMMYMYPGVGRLAIPAVILAAGISGLLTHAHILATAMGIALEMWSFMNFNWDVIYWYMDFVALFCIAKSLASNHAIEKKGVQVVMVSVGAAIIHAPVYMSSIAMAVSLTFFSLALGLWATQETPGSCVLKAAIQSEKPLLLLVAIVTVWAAAMNTSENKSVVALCMVACILVIFKQVFESATSVRLRYVGESKFDPTRNSVLNTDTEDMVIGMTHEGTLYVHEGGDFQSNIEMVLLIAFFAAGCGLLAFFIPVIGKYLVGFRSIAFFGEGETEPELEPFSGTMREGIYALEGENLFGMTRCTARGVVYKNVLHVPNHATGGRTLRYEGMELIAHSIIFSNDLVTYNGGCQLEEYTGGLVQVVIPDRETLSLVPSSLKFIDPATKIVEEAHCVSGDHPCGYSGSPIVDETGRVVGLFGTGFITNTYESVIFPIPKGSRTTNEEILAQRAVTGNKGGKYWITSAPGAGKTTRILPAFVAGAIEHNRKTIILAPTTVVAREMHNVLKGNPDVAFRVTGIPTKNQGIVTVMCHATAVKKLLTHTQRNLFKRASIIIMDEAHVDGSETKAMRGWMEKWADGSKLAIFMTATRAGDAGNSDSNFHITEGTLPSDPRDVHSQHTGNGLVVLPTIRAIEEEVDALKALGLDAYPLHSKIMVEALPKLREKKTRIVIVATEVVEVGFNFDLEYVVDSQRVCRPVSNDAGTEVTIEERDITKAALTQRRGRIGRSKIGTYYGRHSTGRGDETQDVSWIEARIILDALGEDIPFAEGDLEHDPGVGEYKLDQVGIAGLVQLMGDDAVKGYEAPIWAAFQTVFHGEAKPYKKAFIGHNLFPAEDFPGGARGGYTGGVKYSPAFKDCRWNGRKFAPGFNRLICRSKINDSWEWLEKTAGTLELYWRWAKGEPMNPAADEEMDEIWYPLVVVVCVCLVFLLGLGLWMGLGKRSDKETKNERILIGGANLWALGLIYSGYAVTHVAAGLMIFTYVVMHMETQSTNRSNVQEWGFAIVLTFLGFMGVLMAYENDWMPKTEATLRNFTLSVPTVVKDTSLIYLKGESVTQGLICLTFFTAAFGDTTRLWAKGRIESSIVSMFHGRGYLGLSGFKSGDAIAAATLLAMAVLGGMSGGGVILGSLGVFTFMSVVVMGESSHHKPSVLRDALAAVCRNQALDEMRNTNITQGENTTQIGALMSAYAVVACVGFFLTQNLYSVLIPTMVPLVSFALYGKQTPLSSTILWCAMGSAVHGNVAGMLIYAGVATCKNKLNRSTDEGCVAAQWKLRLNGLSKEQFMRMRKVGVTEHIKAGAVSRGFWKMDSMIRRGLFSPVGHVVDLGCGSGGFSQRVAMEPKVDSVKGWTLEGKGHNPPASLDTYGHNIVNMRRGDVFKMEIGKADTIMCDIGEESPNHEVETRRTMATLKLVDAWVQENPTAEFCVKVMFPSREVINQVRHMMFLYGGGCLRLNESRNSTLELYYTSAAVETPENVGLATTRKTRKRFGGEGKANEVPHEEIEKGNRPVSVDYVAPRAELYAERLAHIRAKVAGWHEAPNTYRTWKYLGSFFAPNLNAGGFAVNHLMRSLFWPWKLNAASMNMAMTDVSPRAIQRMFREKIDTRVPDVPKATLSINSATMAWLLKRYEGMEVRMSSPDEFIDSLQAHAAVGAWNSGIPWGSAKEAVQDKNFWRMVDEERERHMEGRCRDCVWLSMGKKEKKPREFGEPKGSRLIWYMTLSCRFLEFEALGWVNSEHWLAREKTPGAVGCMPVHYLGYILKDIFSRTGCLYSEDTASWDTRVHSGDIADMRKISDLAEGKHKRLIESLYDLVYTVKVLIVPKPSKVGSSGSVYDVIVRSDQIASGERLTYAGNTLINIKTQLGRIMEAEGVYSPAEIMGGNDLTSRVTEHLENCGENHMKNMAVSGDDCVIGSRNPNYAKALTYLNATGKYRKNVGLWTPSEAHNQWEGVEFCSNHFHEVTYKNGGTLVIPCRDQSELIGRGFSHMGARESTLAEGAMNAKAYAQMFLLLYFHRRDLRLGAFAVTSAVPCTWVPTGRTTWSVHATHEWMTTEDMLSVWNRVWVEKNPWGQGTPAHHWNEVPYLPKGTDIDCGSWQGSEHRARWARGIKELVHTMRQAIAPNESYVDALGSMGRYKENPICFI